MIRNVDRATMWALREAGRSIRVRARRRVPVYQGARATMELGEVKRRRKEGDYSAAVVRKTDRGNVTHFEGNAVVPGLLRDSITPSRRLRRERDGGYALTIGPRGPRAHLYAAKIEARQPYMRPAYEAVAKDLGKIATRGWQKSMNKAKKK